LKGHQPADIWDFRTRDSGTSSPINYQINDLNIIHREMNGYSAQLWSRFQKFYTEVLSIGLGLGITPMGFGESFSDGMQHVLHKSFKDRDALEPSNFANPNENRMVGHYWLRKPALAPSAALRLDIQDTGKAVQEVVLALGAVDQAENVFYLWQRLAANLDRGVVVETADVPAEARF